MGAPGQAYFCENGHQVGWIENGIYWDQFCHSANPEHLATPRCGHCGFCLEEDIKKQKCPCGKEVTLSYSHYGTLGDCVGWKPRVLSEDEYLKRFNDPILNADGTVLSEFYYRKVKLERYNISEIK